MVSEEMFENVDGQQTLESGILLAHPLAFGPGELNNKIYIKHWKIYFVRV